MDLHFSKHDFSQAYDCIHQKPADGGSHEAPFEGLQTSLRAVNFREDDRIGQPRHNPPQSDLIGDDEMLKINQRGHQQG